MTDAQRRYMHARQRVESMMLNPAKELLEATAALIQDHKAKAAEAEKLEIRVDALLNMNEDGQFPARVALLQIWEFLGVNNQTAAMQKLRDLLHGGVMPS